MNLEGARLSSAIRPYRRWPLVAAFGFAAAALVASAVVMVASMRADAMRRASAQLEAVAALKVDAIGGWIEDRVLAARYACSYPVAVRAAKASLRGRVDPALAGHVEEVFEHFAWRWSYGLVGLLDGAGRPIALAGDEGAEQQLPDRWFLEAALADPRGSAARLAVKGDGRATLDVAVAATSVGSATAFCVVRADASALIEDAVERWPVPSDSGSSALLRAEGDQAVLLLPRRERPPTDFVRVPLAEGDRAAVRAVRGERGLIEGTDRTGARILIRARPIPGTGWLLRTRLDRAEVMAPLRRPTLAIVALVAAFLAVGGALVARWWRGEGRRLEVEEELRRSRERLELAVAGTHAVWDWDLKAGRLQMAGDLARVLGVPPEGLTGDADTILAALVHADDLPQEMAALRAHLRGESALLESEHRAAGTRGQRWVRIRGHTVARDPAGRPTRLAGVASEVTERRRLQAQLELSQRMAGLGRLAAGVAHEINNPLSSVVANLAYVAEELPDAPEQVRQAISEARDAAIRVGDVVRGLKTFSRPGAVPRGPVDVREELEAALRLARHELRHRAVLRVQIGELPRVVADAHELGQVFLNLIVNAAQAIPEGRADEHRVDVEARTGVGGWAVVEIRDTGVGIPPEVLDRIFEPFFTTKPLGIGTGLGLAIAHGIVSGAGGRIDVESQVGRGTTFRVMLPPAPASADAPPPVAEVRAPVPRTSSTRPRVLVVDDEPIVARAAERVLAGYDVVTAVSAAEALRRLDGGERFDAILCDLMMPQMTGMDLYAHVARSAPDLAARFVFVTGGAFTDSAADFLRTTRNGWIEKPFDPRTLREAVERAVAG